MSCIKKVTSTSNSYNKIIYYFCRHTHCTRIHAKVERECNLLARLLYVYLYLFVGDGAIVVHVRHVVYRAT